MWEAAAIALIAAMTGAAVGSFGATAALRFTAGESALGGRSHCDGCARTLGWTETVPFVGYLRSRGVCTTCRHKIDPLHLWGEGLGAATAAIAITLSPDLSGVLLALIGLVLLTQSLIDSRTYRLPNLGNAIVGALCLGLAWVRQDLLVGLIAAVASAALLFALKAWLERRRGRTMLGTGDIKLIAALALGLGAWTPYMIAAAGVLGLMVILVRSMKTQDRLPFGPFIAVAGFLMLLVAGFVGVPI